MSLSHKPASSSSSTAPVARVVPSLRRDDSGAILVIYLAAALLLVGFAWAVISIGQRVYQKEILQTSADAAAFSAAALKAKGLNLLAFCNLLLALLLAIIIFLRLIKYALLVAVIALTAICIIPGGQWACPVAEGVESFREKYSTFADEAEQVIRKAMKGITWVEKGVNYAFPTLSVVEGWYVGTKSDAYKAGPGDVYTVTWPLPIPPNLTLPTKEGTYDELCEHAISDVAWVIGKAIGFVVPIPGAESAIKGAAEKFMGMFEGILCGTEEGGPKTMDVEEARTGQCSAALCAGAHHSVWTAKQVIRIKDIEDEELRKRLIAAGHNPGEFYEFPAGTCTLDGFDEAKCKPSQKHVTCNDGKVYTRLNFQACTFKKKETVDTGGELSDKPLPLVLADDWRDRRFVTAFTLLTDDGGGARRRAVGVGRALTARPGMPLVENGVLTMARAEFYAFNPGHEDLWHMDWRARLVRLKLNQAGETSGSDTGDAASDGVSHEAAGAIQDYLDKFKKTVVSAISDGVEEAVIH